MKLVKNIIFLVVIWPLLFACTDGFESINTNPNAPSVVEPEYVFGLSPLNTMKLMGSKHNWRIFGNYTNQISVIGGSYPNFGYDNDAGDLWSKFYKECLIPVIEIEKNYDKMAGYINRVAIAKIWKNYILSEMVAAWGDIPYKEAARAGEVVPYDRDYDVYKWILEELKECAEALSDDGDKYPSEAEPVFGSDIKKWRKLAHSLRLRIAMRVINYPEPDGNGLAQIARQAVDEELSDPTLLINSNAENCSMQFGGDTQNQNPFFRDITNGSNISDGEYPVVHESFIMWMTAYDDPRIGVFAKKANRSKTKREYMGRPTTNHRPYYGGPYPTDPYVGLKATEMSLPANEFVGRTSRFMFVSYPEICCIRAEAKFLNLWSGPKTAEEYYYEAINSFADRYDSDNISTAELKAYQESPGIKWSTPVDTVGVRSNFMDYNEVSDCYLGGEEDNYKRIIVQHWIALFYQGLDSWTLLRRTQELKFPPHWSCDMLTAGVNGYDDNGRPIYHAYIPQRLVYSIDERSLNAACLSKAISHLRKGSDNLTTRLKWAKPVQTFEGYPNGAIVPDDDYVANMN